MARQHRVTVGPLPEWIPCDRLLGFGHWQMQKTAGVLYAEHTLTTPQAADVAARLRKMGLNGAQVLVDVHPLKT